MKRFPARTPVRSKLPIYHGEKMGILYGTVVSTAKQGLLIERTDGRMIVLSPAHLQVISPLELLAAMEKEASTDGQ